ncbi:hypothetical protein ACFV9C_06610 [Kribbella sp. NPDC059898]|uniref:hypothetical protein n=1 Tax=Kribbella sp. NPDC059898 TaxID=3346995 RepID=UPI00365B9DFB
MKGRSASKRMIVAVGLLSVVAGCGAGGPSTKDDLCSDFDAVSNQLYRGVFNDNGVFKAAGDLAGTARRYQASSAVQASADGIEKISKSKSTTLNQLRNSTIAIADVCGHPLGL